MPQVEIREGYGLTETAALVSSTPPGQARLGSVGKPVPGVDVRIDGDGDVGEICVRSRSVMLGYWQAPDRDGGGDRGRLAAHRRPRLPRRGRLPLRRRPEEGSDHPRRLQRLPARRRGGAARASGRRRRRCRRPPRRGPRRRGGRVRRVEAWPGDHVRRARRVRARSGSAATSTHAKCTSSARCR